MSTDWTFHLNRPNDVYFAGDVVEGTITLITKKEKNIRDVVIKFTGRAKVRWEEAVQYFDGDSSLEMTRHVFQSHETFINEAISVRGEGLLPAGTYNYSFRFTTNADCLTSCEGEFGHIRYELSLVINKFAEYDNVFKKGVTVIKPFDLNLNPSYRVSPAAIKSSKGLCPCCIGFLMRSIYFTLETPFSAYAPGQKIRFTLRIYDKTKGSIEDCYVHLIKKMAFTSVDPGHKIKTKERILKRRVSLAAQIINDVIEDEILIPSTPPSTPETDIVHVKYYLRAYMVHKCVIDSDIIAEEEIIIGTIPVRESLEPNQLLPNNEQEQVLQGQANQGAAAILPAQYSDIRPPNFVGDAAYEPFTDPDVEPKNHKDYRPVYLSYSVNLPRN